MRQEQSRSKTPAARILSLALALCMIAAFVPAFTLTAGAAEPSYTPSDLIGFANSGDTGYSFIGDNVTTSTNWSSYPWSSVPSTSNWYGWSGAAQLYSANGYTFIDAHASTGIVYANGDVTTGTANQDFIVVTWTSNLSSVATDCTYWTDIAMYNSDATIMDTFRYRSGNAEGLNYHWANDGSSATWSSTCTDYTVETNSALATNVGGSADNDTVYYMVYANDPDNENIYTASYYYQTSSASSATWVSTKTYSGTVTGFYGFEIGNNAGNWQRLFNFAVYAGTYPAETNTVTVTYKVDGTEVDSASGTYDTSSADYYTFAEKYVYYNDEVYYAPAVTTDTDEEVTMTVYRYLSSDLKDQSTFDYNGKRYIPANSADTFESIVVNGDFKTGDSSGWTNRQGTANTSTIGTETVNGESVNYLLLPSANGGVGSTQSLGQIWSLDANTTYYMSFMMDDVALSSGALYAALRLSDSADNARALIKDDISSGALTSGTNLVDFAVSSEWTTYQTVFTTDSTNTYLALAFSWMAAKLANVQIVPVVENTDASATVTVNYQVDGTTVTTATKTVVKGNTASFDAISNYAYNGKYYSCDALEYTSVSGDAEYDIALTVDSSKYAPTSDFSYNFTTSEVLYASDTKNDIDFTAEGNEATISIGWNNLRQTIMTFNVSDLMTEGTILSSIVLNMNIGYKNVADYVIAAIDPAMVDTETPSMNTSGTYSSYSAISTLLTDLSAVTVADGTGSTGWNAITLDLSNANDLIDEDGTLALFIYTDNTTYGQFYTYTVNTDYPPYLSDPATTTAVSYTVSYVDENNTALQDPTTYNTTAANTYGYDDEVICPYVTIPYFEGYIFTSKTVSTSDNTITLTYTSTTQVDTDSDFGSNFFENVDDDTQFVSLNMLGAHDAFTSSISSTLKYDAGGIAHGDSGATAASLRVTGGSTVANYSKTQDLTALELLEAGVRYFDVRLSRSTEDASAGNSILYYTAPHTNGVFYTTHGVLGEEFRPIAYTIGQWLKEHPGEVISLYFQEAWDDGDATEATYAAINDILEEAGINDFAPYYANNKTSLKTVTYGNLTDSGEHAGVVMFARAVGYTQGNFYYGSTSATYSWEGKLYSYYDSDNIPDEFDASYIQTQVDTLADYNETDDPSGDHPVYHMARVMQAQTESSNLLSQASSDNSALYTALISESTDTYNYSEWLTALPMVMVNGVGHNTDDLAQLLQNCNKTQDITITYVDESGTELATKTKSVVVGSLYTDETIYTIVDNSYDEGNSVIYSCETLTTKPSTSYGSAVVFTPSYGLTSNVTSTITDTIKIVAAEITDDVYTVRYTTGGTLYTSESGTGTATDTAANPAFSAMNWGNSNYDRVGIAILDVPEIEDENLADYTSFILSATKVRDYGSSNAVAFYAMSTDEYNALDIGDSDAFLAALDNAVEVLSFTSTTNTNDTLSEDVELELSYLADYAGGKVVIIGVSANGLYALSGLGITETETNYGVDLYAGAQIRVGQGMDSEDTSETYQELLGDSGLRFIAVVNKTNTMATDASEIGIAIFNGGFGTTAIDADTAKTMFDETDPVTTITDTTYQDDNETVFTAAIINIDEDNYNRIYVAVPYVVVGGETYYNWEATVARTPYQVAKGILVDSDTTTGYTQVGSDGTAVDADALAAVLNVYTNKTGARVTIAQDSEGYTVTAVTYANGAKEFFDITKSTDDDGNYVFTLSPKSSSTEFYNYARSCFRIKNASADTFEAAVDGASVVLNDEGNIVITVPAE